MEPKDYIVSKIEGEYAYLHDLSGKCTEDIFIALALLPMGVELIGMELTQVRMPIEVREVYDQVNSAAVEAETIVERARSYVTTLIPNAQGTAAGNVATANANYSNKTAAAKSALAEFWGVLEEYEANPEVVKMRLYNEKVAKIIAAIGQVRIVEDEQSTIYIKP